MRKRNNYNNNERSNSNLRKYGNVEFRVIDSIYIWKAIWILYQNYAKNELSFFFHNVNFNNYSQIAKSFQKNLKFLPGEPMRPLNKNSSRSEIHGSFLRRASIKIYLRVRIADSTHAQCWKILLSVVNSHQNAILVSIVSVRKSDLSSVRSSHVYENPEAATRGVLKKKVFLKIWQNSQENTGARVSFLMKLQAWGLQLH